MLKESVPTVMIWPSEAGQESAEGVGVAVLVVVVVVDVTTEVTGTAAMRLGVIARSAAICAKETWSMMND
jgi:hypothetical protein